jgi:hypothetical protein
MFAGIAHHTPEDAVISAAMKTAVMPAGLFQQQRQEKTPALEGPRRYTLAQQLQLAMPVDAAEAFGFGALGIVEDGDGPEHEQDHAATGNMIEGGL